MKVLFLYKIPNANITMPLGILYLISSIRKAGHQCDILFIDLEFNIFSKVKSYNPEVICYSCTTGFHAFYIHFNRHLKKRFNFFALFGGPHATFFPENLIIEEGVDALCVGEGENAIVEFLEKLENKKSYTDTLNFWFKIDGNIIKNGIRNLAEDINTLPFPDRDFLYQYPLIRNYGQIEVITSRGCPFNCTYCFNHTFKELYKDKGKILRTRSPENVVEEIFEFKKKFHLSHIYFIDDTFPSQLEWISLFSELYRRYIAVPFFCHINPALVSEENIALLKHAGLRSVIIGIESGNESISKEILGRNISNQDIMSTAKAIRNQGIKLFTFNMVGIPTETIETALDTIDLNIQCKTDYAWVSILQPYPKTRILDIAKSLGLLKSEDYTIGELYHYDTPLHLQDKRKFINLHYLFSVCVAYPFFRTQIECLIALPLKPLYIFIYYIHKIFCYYKHGQVILNFSFIIFCLKRFFIIKILQKYQKI